MWARTSKSTEPCHCSPAIFLPATVTAQSATSTCCFDDHHGELARILLDQIDTLSAKIDMLTARTDQLIAEIPGVGPPPRALAMAVRHRTGLRGPAARDRAPRRGHRDRSARRQGHRRQVGLDMAQFPTAGHLVSGAKISPRTIQSGPQEPVGYDRERQPLSEARSERGGRCCRTDRYLLGDSVTGGSSSVAASSRPSSLWPVRSSSSSGTSRRPDRTLR